MRRIISKDDEEKFKKSKKLFMKLAEVTKRHLEIHNQYCAGCASESDVIAIDDELVDTLEEWRKSLVLFKKID